MATADTEADNATISVNEPSVTIATAARPIAAAAKVKQTSFPSWLPNKTKGLSYTEKLQGWSFGKS